MTTMVERPQTGNIMFWSKKCLFVTVDFYAIPSWKSERYRLALKIRKDNGTENLEVWSSLKNNKKTLKNPTPYICSTKLWKKSDRLG